MIFRLSRFALIRAATCLAGFAACLSSPAAWADRMNFDLSALPNLLAYKVRVGARPKVQEALTKEGLLKAA